MTHVRIALDAMGGDHVPGASVHGGIDAAVNLDAHVTLVGDRQQIISEIGSRSYPTHLISIVDAPERVSMEDDAISAVRRKKRASIPVGLEMVKQGEADAFVSAGNTGAVVASSVVSLGRLPGVQRPGIAIPLPTASGDPLLLIDAGALVDPKPEHLWQHARLAVTYARVANQITSPTVGLISNGEEAGKGNALTRAAHALLSEDKSINFIGNVESRALGDRPCDVLVTDGFTGNIILKTGEGVVTLLEQSFRNEFRKRWYTAILASLLKPAFRRAGKALDYREYGGAPLLGVDGLVIIAHGSSDRTALLNAIGGAIDAAGRNTLGALRGAVTER